MHEKAKAVERHKLKVGLEDEAVVVKVSAMFGDYHEVDGMMSLLRLQEGILALQRLVALY